MSTFDDHRTSRNGRRNARADMNVRCFAHPEMEEIRLHDVLFALSDPTRLAIAAALADGVEHSSGALAGGIPKSTMSHHLKILREAGVTLTRQDGTRCRISLRRHDLEARFPGLIELVLRHAQQDHVKQEEPKDA
jgi:DNA-binding transcriptional ArsR family regulator